MVAKADNWVETSFRLLERLIYETALSLHHVETPTSTIGPTFPIEIGYRNTRTYVPATVDR